MHESLINTTFVERHWKYHTILGISRAFHEHLSISLDSFPDRIIGSDFCVSGTMRFERMCTMVASIWLFCRVEWRVRSLRLLLRWNISELRMTREKLLKYCELIRARIHPELSSPRPLSNNRSLMLRNWTIDEPSFWRIKSHAYLHEDHRARIRYVTFSNLKVSNLLLKCLSSGRIGCSLFLSTLYQCTRF